MFSLCSHSGNLKHIIRIGRRYSNSGQKRTVPISYSGVREYCWSDRAIDQNNSDCVAACDDGDPQTDPSDNLLELTPGRGSLALVSAGATALRVVVCAGYVKLNVAAVCLTRLLSHQRTENNEQTSMLSLCSHRDDLKRVIRIGRRYSGSSQKRTVSVSYSCVSDYWHDRGLDQNKSNCVAGWRSGDPQTTPVCNLLESLWSLFCSSDRSAVPAIQNS